MGLFEKMGAAMGIGATEVALRLDMPASEVPEGKPAFGALETVTGTVAWRGGNTRQTGQLLVTVRESWIIMAGKTPVPQERFYSQITLNDGLVVEAHTPEQETSFAVTLPFMHPQGHQWFVEAHFKVEGAAERIACQEITLLPPAPVRGLIACLKVLGDFRPIGEGALYTSRFQQESDGAYYNFAPPAELKSALDGVKILIKEVALPPEGDLLRGVLDINPQEHSIVEYLSGGREHVLVPFTLSAAELAVCAPGGGGSQLAPAEVAPPYTHLVDALRELLSPFLDDSKTV